jgi:hypothetical protein
LVAGGKVGLLFGNNLVLLGNVSNGAKVEAQGVVVIDVFGDEAASLFDVEQGAGPNAVGFLSRFCQRSILPLYWDSKASFYMCQHESDRLRARNS